MINECQLIENAQSDVELGFVLCQDHEVEFAGAIDPNYIDKT